MVYNPTGYFQLYTDAFSQEREWSLLDYEVADRLNYEHRFPGVVGGNRKKCPVIEIKDSNINVE